MKNVRFISAMLSGVLLVLLSCDKVHLEKYTVSATLIKNHIGEYDVANILVGKVSMDIPILMDNYYIPDSSALPGNVEPVKDAIVKVGSTEIPMNADGVYSKTDISLTYKKAYDLSITIDDSVYLHSKATVPDSFSIITPYSNDTVNMHGVKVVWHRSDSADFYIVYLDYAQDSVSGVNGYENIVNDTSVVLPDSSFTDMDGNPVEGLYNVYVIAVNGAWKHGILSFILGGGNIDGAWGTYAILTPSNNSINFYVKNEGKK